MWIILGFLVVGYIIFWTLSRIEDLDGDWTSLLDINAGKKAREKDPEWIAAQQEREKKKEKALYQLKKPVDAVALLVVGIASADGPISKNTQQELELFFEADFGLTRTAAKELFKAALAKLDYVSNLPREVPKIMGPSIMTFRPAQADGLPKVLLSIASLEGGEPSQRQIAIVNAVIRSFMDHEV